VQRAKSVRDAGIKLIVGYKLTKAVLELVMGGLLLLVASRVTADVDHLVHAIRTHASAAWSLALANNLGRLVTRHHVVIVATAAILDSTLSCVEGWALHKRYRWSEWLIIGTTSCLLPFEIVALAHRASGGRMAIFLVNVAIVAYLAQRASIRTVRRPRTV
jgi:uncharacterized membrane protein (DUF2068 family)